MKQINYNEQPLLHIEDLKQHFRINRKFTTNAVDGISLDIWQGETYGLVGESGSGKSTTGRSIIRLYKPTSGKMVFDGRDISGKMSKADEQFLRQNMQMIFQDPMASLNPRKKVSQIVAQGLLINHLYKDRADLNDKVIAMLERVGLSREHATRYPAQFSGGQRQRIGIARALITNPKLVIADEAISALDVSIQAQVVNLMRDIQDELGTTYLFIAHDLLVVRHISDRIAVMYLGKMVELADSNEIYNHPLHPYSQSLISAVPYPDPKVARENKRIVLSGDIPSPLNAPSGCPFRTRCKYATDACAESMPELKDVGGGHLVACHRHAEINK